MPEILPAGLDRTDRPRWLAERRLSIGASDAAAVLGISPWAGPWEVWADKTGLTGDREPNDAMDWGHRLEPVVAGWWAEQHPGLDVRPAGLWRHPDRPWAHATPDRLIWQDGAPVAGLEIKTTSARRGHEWSETEAPPEVVVQVAHSMAVVGVDVWHLAALIGGQRPVALTFCRDHDLERQLLDREQTFWAEHVTTGQPPPIDLRSVGAVVDAWPEDHGATVTLPEPAVWLARELAAVKAQAADLTAQAEILEAEVKAAMGDAAEAVDADGNTVATWRTHTRRGLDVKRLAADHPHVADLYRTETPYRTFRLKG